MLVDTRMQHQYLLSSNFTCRRRNFTLGDEEEASRGTPISTSGTPLGVTPRRAAKTENSPAKDAARKLTRRAALASTWEGGTEGIREQLGSLGIGPQPCKVHLKVCCALLACTNMAAVPCCNFEAPWVK